MKKIHIFALLVLTGVLAANRLSFAATTCTSTTNPMRIVIRDADGVLQPNINYIVYQQLTNPDGGFYFGTTALATGKTDAGGQDLACLDPKKQPYALKIYESNATYGYFAMWSNQLTTLDNVIKAELRMSSLYVLMRDAEGNVIKNQKFDVYVQSFDVNNQPIVDETKLNQDKLVVSDINTGEFGARHVYLGPGYYVVRVHATGGKTYFYIWNQKVEDGKVARLDYKLSTLRAILEDGYASVVKNQKLSLYTQKYDVRGKPIVGDLVAADLSTESTGKVDAYIPANVYALKIPATNQNSYYYNWKIVVSSEELTTTTYRLSGFRVIIRDDKGRLARNSKFDIGTQKTDALGKPVVNTTILRGQSTGEPGFLDLYLIPDTYVLIYGDKRLYNLDVYDNQFTKVDWPRTVSLRPQSEVELSNPFGNAGLTLRRRSLPRVKLPNFKTNLSKAYRIQAPSIQKPYTVIFTYRDQTLKQKNTKADKVRIAFYNEVTKTWRYVGRNTPSRHQAKATLKEKGTIVLVAIK